MKKILIGLLALISAASVSVTAYAADTDGTSPVSGDVQGRYVAGSEAPETIAVDVTWEDMTFTYRESAQEWDPDSHEYTQADGKWDATPKYITVTNHSNINVQCKIICEWNGDIEGGSDLEFNYNRSEQTTVLYSPKSSWYSPLKQPIFVTGGKPTKSGDIGTITVEISNEGADISSQSNGNQTAEAR